MSIQRYLLGSGYATGSQTFSATGTFTAPQGVYAVTVQCWAGGGGGGSDYAASFLINRSGGGGAGGGFAQSVLTVIPGTSYTVTVGTGGGLATNGGDSWFNTSGTITAYGGYKGNNVTNGIGGVGRSGTGTTNYTGVVVEMMVFTKMDQVTLIGTLEQEAAAPVQQETAEHLVVLSKTII